MTHPVRILGVTATLVMTTSAIAVAQHTRGTMGVPRIVTAPPPSTTNRTPPPPPSTRGVMSVPRYDGPTAPRHGDLPRITAYPNGGYGYIRGRRIGSGYSAGSGYAIGSGYSTGASMSGGFAGHRFEPGTSRRWRPGYTQPGITCRVGCFRLGFGTGRYFGSFMVGYPFAVPIVVPYFFYSTATYVEPAVETYVPAVEAAPRAASKLIVIGGGSGGGGDALTVETLGDSVRLNWLGSNRPAREVTLFVADSTQRPLATRRASASSPTATFEIATLSEPVAFAGVTVIFADGVTTTTTVPYRGPRR